MEQQNIRNRVAELLNTSVSNIILVEETEDQVIVTTNNYKNYIYSIVDDTIIDIDEIVHPNKVEELDLNRFLTPEEKDDYYRENEKLIGFALKKINKGEGVEEEELRDVCIFGFAKALNSFDKKNGVKFSTYCVKCMLNEMYYYLRKEQKKLLNNVSFEKVLSMDANGNKLTVEDTISNTQMTDQRSVEDLAIISELRKVLFNALEWLSEDEQYLIVYRYGLDNNHIKTQNTIAEELNMSQANISKLEKTCLSKMRLILKKLDYQYNAKYKVITHSEAISLDTGSYGKDEWVDKSDELHIMTIAATKLRMNIDFIEGAIPNPNDANEFYVTFTNNNRIYAIVNNASNKVSLATRKLSNEEIFVSMVLRIPSMDYVLSRKDAMATKYNIDYDPEILREKFALLDKEEQHVLKHIFAIFDTERKSTTDLAKEMNKSVQEIMEIQRDGMLELEEHLIDSYFE